MSKIEVDTIDTVTGTSELTIGGTNATDVTLGSGVKITNLESTGIDDNATSTAITIDSSENVGIGTSSPTDVLTVSGANAHIDVTNSSNSSVALIGASGSTADAQNRGYLRLKKDGSTSDGITLNTNGDSFINNGGNVGIGTTSPVFKFHVEVNENNGYAGTLRNTNVNGYILELDYPDNSPDNNTVAFLVARDSTTNRCIIWSDGDLDNHDNSYGSISDERIKQDIRDSNSQWNDIKAVRIRNFKKKDDVRQYGENAKEQIGVVAQELETISPKLIKHVDPTPSDILSDSSFGTLYQEGDEIPEGKNVGDVKEVHEQVKKVSYSVLYMKSIKALQEAMERIETLEARITTLENA